MSVSLTNVVVLDNPAPFTNPLQFQITFEASDELKEDLAWRVVYVGSATSEKMDQELDTALVGPVNVGLNQFVFTCDPPVPSSIPKEDLLGVTVVLISCSYKKQEFVRVGYYLSNTLYDEEGKEVSPESVEGDIDISRVRREIVADKPRVTKFDIEWDQPLEKPAEEVVTEEPMDDDVLAVDGDDLEEEEEEEEEEEGDDMCEVEA
eukprot:TRINITY_DN69129_c0_g1_i1.p1 TRINITY_DN69129_c0_g1~~TRINITY_DN69129_c0_g1_i1.p1  ORF type:complete len:216 (+),score=81.38 TRINITY_DN69129_c0_g1_i1:33-650(+)